MLDIEYDKGFFNLGVTTHEKGFKSAAYFNTNTVFISNKNNLLKEMYKKKYNVIFDFNHTQKINRRFKEPVHRLTIAGNKLQEIKSLPKGLLSLWLQGIPKGYKLKLITVPKSIVSIFYRWTDYTLGDDIRQLKNLKVFGAPDNHTIFNIPKFPKSIEYVDLSDCQICRFDDNGLDNFKLSDYPNLKYINLSGNWIRKIPMEWKKKNGIKIIYTKQKK
jgi:Leucine-rich repeat (LRR) protein